MSRANAGGPGAFGALGWAEEDPAPAVAGRDEMDKGKGPMSSGASSSSTPLVLDRGTHPNSKDIAERVKDAEAARVAGLREVASAATGGAGGDGWEGGVGGGIDRLGFLIWVSGARIRRARSGVYRRFSSGNFRRGRD